MPEHYRQFPLPLRFDESATIANFFPADNGVVLAALRKLGTQPGWLFLHGPQGSGVSHLLQACCNQALAANKQAIYLDMAEMPAQASSAGGMTALELLEGLEQFELLCIDNVDAIVDDRTWQEALFYLLVRLQARPQHSLLIGAHRAASQLQQLLPDLRSRLESAVSFALQMPNDEQRCAIIQLRAKSLGCDMNDEVAKFIVQRYSRKLPDLVDAVHRLDRQALSHARRLTLPFVKQVLSL